MTKQHFGGKMKALTLSYDDGVVQDIRLVEILNRYGLKGTFNLNSGLCGRKGFLPVNGKPVVNDKLKSEDIRHVYEGHEIAVHTLTHPTLTTCSEEEIIRQVEEDRLTLSELAGYEVVGMAYPGGGVNNDDRVAQIIRDHTGVRYCRTNGNSGSFEIPDDLYRFEPTVYDINIEQMFTLGQQFIELQPNRPQLLYIWGHSYQFDADDTWDQFEEFCRMISGRPDIFYGTNRQALL